MKNIIYYSSLFDYYSSLLTDIQKLYFQEYYFNNLTIIEIATNYKVSKNAISKTLKEVLEKLDYYELKLKLYNNRQKIEKLLDKDSLNIINDLI